MNRQQPTMNNLDILDTQQRIDKLTVAKLKDIARSIGLALSGRKLDIQERIKLFFSNGLRSNDIVRLLTIRTLVLKASNDQAVPNYQMLYISIQSNSHQYETINQYSSAASSVSGGVMPTVLSKPHGEAAAARPWLYFKESPFYRLKRLVHGTPVLAQRAPDTRGTCSAVFVLNESETSLLGSGTHFHLLLLSGAYEGVTSQEAYVQFPQPLEIHFNGTLVKDNVKGIKNKPGTARPADLTKYLKAAPSVNKLDLVYAFAKTDYLLFCYIVEMISPEQVLDKIISQPHILKLSTIKEIQREQDEEDDLLEMQEVITLRCPLTYGRMRYPSKSLYCKHIQCFDALSFLQLQEQASTWSCPICQKPVTVKTLAIDDYLDEVIRNTGEDDEAIEIEHNGNWKVKKEEDINGNNQAENAGALVSGISTALTAKKEESTPAIPNESSANPPDVIEIISLDSDSDDEEEDMNDLVQELEREVLQEESATESVLQVISPETVSNNSEPVSVEASVGPAVAPVQVDESAPLPPPLDPPPLDAISATPSMIAGTLLEIHEAPVPTQVDEPVKELPIETRSEQNVLPPQLLPILAAPVIAEKQQTNGNVNGQYSKPQSEIRNTSFERSSNGQERPAMPSFSSLFPSWSSQNLLRPANTEVNGRPFSPSRFGPPPSQPQPAPNRQNSLPVQSIYTDYSTQNSGPMPQLASSIRSPSMNNISFSQPKRVNLGFSLHGDILAHQSGGGDQSVTESSMSLSSPLNNVVHYDISTTRLAPHLISPLPSSLNNSSIRPLQRSPSRFVPVSHQGLSSTTTAQQQHYQSSTPTKRTLDLVELVSSDDDDVPLAKR